MIRVYGLTGLRLPIHPQPYPDELFTHWFYRLAHSNYLKAQTLADYLFGNYSSFWARDQDKLASPVVLEKLAELTGKNADELHALTLASYQGKLYSAHNPCGHTRWILPVGVFHRTRRRYGLQFCPLCLREDSDPYFRRHWRLAFTTVCERHGTLMHDRCHQCGAPVAFFRNDLGHRNRHDFIARPSCDVCGVDLSTAPAYDPPGVNGQTSIIQRSIISLREIGWWFAGNQALGYGHLYFDVLHHLSTFLASRLGRKLLNDVEREIGCSPFGGRQLTPQILEFRDLQDRHWLIQMSLWMLQEWPDRFIQLCASAKMWQSWLLKGETFPWWFESSVKERLDRSLYTPNAEEAASAENYLVRRNLSVSRHSVGRLLGSDDFEVTGRYAVKKKSALPQSNEEFHKVLEAFDRRIASIEKGSLRSLLVERDRAILLTMQIMNWPADYVLQLALTETHANLKSRAWPVLLREEVERFIANVRPLILKGKQSSALFVSSMGKEIHPDNLALSIRKATTFDQVFK